MDNDEELEPLHCGDISRILDASLYDGDPLGLVNWGGNSAQSVSRMCGRTLWTPSPMVLTDQSIRRRTCSRPHASIWRPLMRGSAADCRAEEAEREAALTDAERAERAESDRRTMARFAAAVRERRGW